MKKFKKPKTYLGFPVGEESQEGQPAKQKGLALMVAVMIISTMMMFAADFIVSSTVNLTRASSERDNIRAEYVAKSGMNWALWLNLFDYGLQIQLGSDPATKMMKDQIGTLWDKLGMIFPYPAGLDLEESDKFAAALGLSKIMDSKVLDELKSLGGSLGVDVADEGGKINLNVCFQSTAECAITMLQLEGLMSCTAVEQDYNKQKNLKVSELARRITDWIDKNSVAEQGAGYLEENEAYQKRKPPHKAKNSPMDSVNELLLIEGWTRELHAYYSPYLTVWPFLDATSKNNYKLNINTISQEALRCMFGKELNSPEALEKFAKKVKEISDEGGKLAGSDGDIQKILSDVIGYKGDTSEKGKPGDKASWLTTEAKTFKIRSSGKVGEQSRTVEVIIQRLTSQQMSATNAQVPWTLSFFKMY